MFICFPINVLAQDISNSDKQNKEDIAVEWLRKKFTHFERTSDIVGLVSGEVRGEVKVFNTDIQLRRESDCTYLDTAWESRVRELESCPECKYSQGTWSSWREHKPSKSVNCLNKLESAIVEKAEKVFPGEYIIRLRPKEKSHSIHGLRSNRRDLVQRMVNAINDLIKLNTGPEPY